jgi:hypothetical protein
MHPEELDLYQAQTKTAGRSSVLLSGGWNGAANGGCEAAYQPTAFARSAPELTGFSALHSHGNDAETEQPLAVANCLPFTDLWRWEAGRESVISGQR